MWPLIAASLCIGALVAAVAPQDLVVPVLFGLFISVIVAGVSVVAANPNTRSNSVFAWVLFRGFNPLATIKTSRAASAFWVATAIALGFLAITLWKTRA